MYPKICMRYSKNYVEVNEDSREKIDSFAAVYVPWCAAAKMPWGYS